MPQREAYSNQTACPCADPGIFVGGGGGGVQVSLTKKKSSDNAFFFFFSPQLILQKSNGQFQTIIFQGSREVQHFPGGGPTFSGGGGGGGGGSKCLFPIETHITCDFPGGSGRPIPPPLDPHLLSLVSLVFECSYHIRSISPILF